jgi:hypothetical protein
MVDMGIDNSQRRSEGRHYLPKSEYRTWLTDTVDFSSSFRSSSPFLSLSSLSNCASINVIHSCLEILPSLFVSIRSNNSFTFSSANESLVGFLGMACFCATAAPIKAVALNNAINRFLRVMVAPFLMS